MFFVHRVDKTQIQHGRKRNWIYRCKDGEDNDDEDDEDDEDDDAHGDSTGNGGNHDHRIIDLAFYGIPPLVGIWNSPVAGT